MTATGFASSLAEADDQLEIRFTFMLADPLEGFCGNFRKTTLRLWAKEKTFTGKKCDGPLSRQLIGELSKHHSLGALPQVSVSNPPA
jgi:hypothetical protein